MRSLARTLVCAAALVLALPAQGELQKKEAELGHNAAGILGNFARNAMLAKVATRAKQAYDLVVEQYEPDNAQARKALGFRKNKDQWELVPLEKRPKWEDKANNEQRYRVIEEWSRTAKKLGDLHRALGLELLQGENAARGKYHLERAVAYYPPDKEAHLALGHIEYQGFYGTEEQVAFVKRMREIETKALELAKQEYATQPLAPESLPEELKKTNLEFHGAKSEHFTIWTRGTQENADNCVKWSERGLDFMTYLCGEEQARRRAFVPRMKTFSWIGFVWTTKERDDFLRLNPQIYEGKTIEDAKTFANVTWKSAQGPAMVMMKLTPAQMHDSMIAWVFHLGVGQGQNEALVEGLHHAATWYLMSTSITTFGALPEGTVGKKELKLPDSTNWWLRKIRDDALAGADWPLNQVPRERLSSFRNDVRVKSWSFMTWVVARYPDKWLEFFTKVPAKFPLPEQVEKLGEQVFGRKLADVEAEWREWARGDSGVAAATGYGPPLLPERPNKEELAALDRMNQVRNTHCAYVLTGSNRTEGAMQPLPPTDLDAEASIACEDHARYLTKWPQEHLKWPEAHEENPAREGFTPRGMRAGMRSVIIWSTGTESTDFARDSVDGWIGTVYHRFPLLKHNIYRFGYAFVADNGYSIGVLDMGSLEEPYDPAKAPMVVAWPPPGMKEVPRKFHGVEYPNPLDDQPENERDITRTGYPVSLQLQQEYAAQLIESAISLYEVKGRGKVPDKYCVPEGSPEFQAWSARRGDAVPTWNHTPAEPLLKRMEEKEVVFAIPKEFLKKSTTYQAEVRLVAQGNSPLYFIWEFTTGGQEEGLKF